MQIWGVLFQAETWSIWKCDRSSDKMIAGVMRECNEKQYNNDNTVSNERVKEQWKSSSWEIIMLLASFITFVQDINIERDDKIINVVMIVR